MNPWRCVRTDWSSAVPPPRNPGWMSSNACSTVQPIRRAQVSIPAACRRPVPPKHRHPPRRFRLGGRPRSPPRPARISQAEQGWSGLLPNCKACRASRPRHPASIRSRRRWRDPSKPRHRSVSRSGSFNPGCGSRPAQHGNVHSSRQDRLLLAQASRRDACSRSDDKQIPPCDPIRISTRHAGRPGDRKTPRRELHASPRAGKYVKPYGVLSK